MYTSFGKSETHVCAVSCAVLVTNTQLDSSLTQTKEVLRFSLLTANISAAISVSVSIVSLHITIIQISSTQKQSFLFDITDGVYSSLLGGVLHCCLFQPFNN